jgi:glutathione S-transferase
MEDSMNALTVYTVPGSPFGRTVLAMLEEKGAPYRIAPVAPGTLKTPEHLMRHAFGRVPVLDHDGFLPYETQAIVRYLDRILSNTSLTPADQKVAARMDQVMNVSIGIFSRASTTSSAFTAWSLRAFLGWLRMRKRSRKPCPRRRWYLRSCRGC